MVFKMKKSNLLVLLFLCLLIVATAIFAVFRKKPSDTVPTNSDSVQTAQSSTPESSTDTTGGEKESEISDTVTSNDTAVPNPDIPDTTTSTDTPVPQPDIDISMNDSLFIGDSRTVGLMEYSCIDGADYFCNVGMSVYNIHQKPLSVPNVGKVTLTELLNNKKYGKIYIMLGVNEVGYKSSTTVKKYSELLDFVQARQPDATVFIQANLHVTKSRSDTDSVVNNAAIDALNSEFAKLADGKSRLYIDANVLFDDESGGLSPDKSQDSTHLYAKYYKEWGEWIVKQTAVLIGG